jgi:hypothetical protein
MGCCRGISVYALTGLRSFTLLTNFRPDQTSVTAHTLTSTSPAARPIARTSFSVRSVATPELFFGQHAHSIPAGASVLASFGNCLDNSLRDLVNSMAKSIVSEFFLSSFFTSQAARGSRNSFRTSAGACNKCARKPGLIPNFFESGVPEYPGIRSL